MIVSMKYNTQLNYLLEPSTMQQKKLNNKRNYSSYAHFKQIILVYLSIKHTDVELLIFLFSL